jgi:hypothetical protein
MRRPLSHLICTDQPLGGIASWARASARAAGHGCDVVPFEAAMDWLDAEQVDTVLVDMDKLDPAALTLLSALWKRQSITPVWMASHSGGRCEGLLRHCADGFASRGRGRQAVNHVESVSVRALSTLSAARLMALRHIGFRLQEESLPA